MATVVSRNLIHLAIAFMLLFTSVNSATTIISQLLRQLGYNNLGLYTIFINAAFIVVGGLVIPYFWKRFNSKRMMLVSLVCYTFKLSTYVIIGFIKHHTVIVYILVIFGAALSGFSSCFLWCSQGDYMHTLCEREGKQLEKGYYFGLFYKVYSVNNVLAGIATTFLLGYFSAEVYFVILALSGAMSIVWLTFFVQRVDKPTALKQSVITKPDMEGNKLLAREEDNKKVSAMDIFRYYPKIGWIVTFFGTIGFLMGFYSSSLGDFIADTLPAGSDVQTIRMRIGIGIILLGFGEIAGGHVSGYNADRMKVQTIGGIAISIYLGVCQLSQLQTQLKSAVFVYILSFLWGFVHSYWQNWALVVCSVKFKGDLQSFTINKQLHSVTLCMYQIVVIFGNPTISLMLTIMTMLTIFCIVSLRFLDCPEKLENTPEEDRQPIEIENIENTDT